MNEADLSSHGNEWSWPTLSGHIQIVMPMDQTPKAQTLIRKYRVKSSWPRIWQCIHKMWHQSTSNKRKSRLFNDYQP